MTSWRSTRTSSTARLTKPAVNCGVVQDSKAHSRDRATMPRMRVLMSPCKRVLAHGIAESQVFVDGNKRTALIALLTFLDINGWMLETDDVALASWILDLSRGLTAEDLAQRLRGVSGRSKVVLGRLAQLGSASIWNRTQTGVVGWANRTNTRMIARPIATPISTLMISAVMVRFSRLGAK
jgi:hypothetical protein